MDFMKTSKPTLSNELAAAIRRFNDIFTALENEISRVIVGNEDIVRGTLATIFAGGHALLEGVPGLGKTLLVKSISRSMGLLFKRIQFTPDLMPMDVTGTQVLTEGENGKKEFVFKAGPLFANIVLADEINRATPKTQSALLEAMEERQISIMGETYKIKPPFFVLATQNPVELEGTYPLPEAQLDRFLVKLLLKPPTSANLKAIVERTTGTKIPEAQPVLGNAEMLVTIENMKKLVRQVVVADPMQDILVRILAKLTPNNEYAGATVKQYVRFGPGPRGAQAVILLAKVMALLDGRINLSFDDIQAVLTPCLRHRLLLNFQAEADGVSSDEIIEEVKGGK
ncbi:MAG: AAA family ATPase [Bdellovibrionota bacterium]|jgi:MoxR-like ATPase